MQPAPLNRAPALAWLMAHAYARHRALAVLAYPLALVITLTYQLRRGVYETDDRNGMVIVTRWRPGLDAVLVIGLILVSYAALGLLAGLLSFVHPLLGPGVFAAAGLLGVAGAVVLAQGQQSATPISKDTPRGHDRWQVAGLAQRPGTRLSALLLTRHVITDVVPAGDVLVTAAGTERLEQAYIRAGFTPVGRRRLYRIACPGPHRDPDPRPHRQPEVMRPG